MAEYYCACGHYANVHTREDGCMSRTHIGGSTEICPCTRWHPLPMHEDDGFAGRPQRVRTDLTRGMFESKERMYSCDRCGKRHTKEYYMMGPGQSICVGVGKYNTLCENCPARYHCEDCDVTMDNVEMHNADHIIRRVV